MGNVLIYWMVVPIVLLVVYSISRMDYAGITEGLVLGNYNEGVFGTAWILVAVMSTFELLLFSFARSRRTESRHISDLVRVAVWVVVSVLLAYVYILGMLGNRCVASGNRISLGNKLDYVFIMCWLIGAFFVISSYIFYAKEVMNTLVNDRTITMYALIFAGVLFFVSCFNYEAVRIMMINWLVYGDVLLSLGLPAFVISAAKRTVR
jgi:hypothetical protein